MEGKSEWKLCPGLRFSLCVPSVILCVSVVKDDRLPQTRRITEVHRELSNQEISLKT